MKVSQETREPAEQTDGQRQHEGVVEERQRTVERDQFAKFTGARHDVGDLIGHPDAKREIDELGVVGGGIGFGRFVQTGRAIEIRAVAQRGFGGGLGIKT